MPVTNRPLPFGRAVLAVAALAAAFLASGASAAAPRDDAPAVAAEDLAKDLAAARARIAELEAEVAALTAALAAAGGSVATPAAAPVASAPTSEFASAGAVRKALEAEYTKALAESLPAPGDAAARARFVTALDRWVATVNRSHRKQVNWTVRVTRAVPHGDRLALTLEPIDPTSGTAIDEAFTIALEPRLARRVQERGRVTPSDQPWTLVGVFVPEIRGNAARMERGIFDQPPLLGPGAEFLYRIEPQSLAPVRRAAPNSTPGATPETPATP